jgi:hypothetical protein
MRQTPFHAALVPIALVLTAAAPASKPTPALPGRAPTTTPSTEPAADGARLDFAVSAAGLRVLTIETVFRVARTGYQIDTLAKTVGVAGFFHHGEQLNTASGTWAGNRALPNRYVSIATWSGKPRPTVIAYRDNRPVVLEHVPPPGQKSLPVPATMLTGASNLLSAFAEMIRNTAQTGRCDTQLNTYDGRVLSEVVSRSAGIVQLHEHLFSGPALRCDYAQYPLAGLPPGDGGEGPAPAAQRGTIWLGRIIPGLPAMPVQLSFQTNWFGQVTAHLISAQPLTAEQLQAAVPHS